MLNIYLLRHGETVWNAEGNKYCGRTDIALTQKGIAQANSAKIQLENTSFLDVYSSPLQRAYDTAKIVSGRNDVLKDIRIVEADFGNWEGKTKEKFITEDPELWSSWESDPASTKAGETGETALEVVTRVDDFFSSLIEKYKSGNILVVAHNGVNRFYLAYKLGMDLKNYRKIVQENSSVTLFTLDNRGELTLKLLNSRG